MEQNNQFRSRFFIGVLIVVATALIASSVILITMGVKQNKYNSAIENAKHYFTAGDYQSAIVEYENALALDNKKENPYLNIASAYINLQDYNSALGVIDRGLLLIESNKLQQKRAEIQQLIALLNQPETEIMTLEDIQTASSGANLENNVFDMVAAYTYTEYYRDFGNVTGTSDGTKVTINYVNGGFRTVYYDLNGEKVIDSATNMPYANVKPTEVSFNSLYSVFSSGSEKFAISYAKLKEMFGESLKYHQDENGMYYITAEYKNCRIYVETDSNGNIISETAWNKLEPMKHTKFESDEEVDGEAKGYVQDAITGKGMKADMKVRERGKKKGTVIDELTSNKDGSYVFGGKQGTYTIEVSAKGYITEYIDVEIIKDQVKTGNNVVLSPEVGDGEIRIVLTWGNSPTDLDSYAVGRSSSGKNFNINFTNTNVKGIGNLDVDDTTSYGPETITITDIGASFVYSVVDFRAQGTMGSSNATVKIYLPGEASAKVFQIPSGEGLLWNVFKYENGQVTKINELTSDVNTSRFHIKGR